MRRNGCTVLLALAVILLVAWPAAAQKGVTGAVQRQPEAGAFAIGAEVGFFVPTTGLDVGASFGALAELYMTPRVSIRGAAGTAGTGYTGGTTTFRRSWAMADIVYNWEADLWHPFIAVGVGAYFPQVGSSYQTKAGAHIGGGIEYFARPNVTIKLEGLYHFVEHAGIGSTDASGATLTVGLKRYF